LESLAPAPLSTAFLFQKLRSLFGVLGEPFFALAARAYQIVYWSETSRFCGRCGSPTQILSQERATICPVCQLENYPRIAPAVLVAVLKKDSILLAWSKRSTEPRYSILAGFVEPGETLEQCVTREVKEEVGITVESIRYFGSQPWPFPHSLMVAFTARYKNGSLKIEEQELGAADWFKKDNLPPLPGPISLSRKLIDWFAADYSPHGSKRRAPDQRGEMLTL
jgi:NAD+ diphosphatase